jgi:signal transduction histidine kinase
MARLIAILTLLVALLAIATVEQVCIHRVYDKMKTETAAISALVNATEDETEINDYVKIRAENLHKYWIKREKGMSIFVRHIDLSYISDALIYANNFIEFDNKEEAMAGLQRLEYLLDTYSNVYGFNGLNIL